MSKICAILFFLLTISSEVFAFMEFETDMLSPTLKAIHGTNYQRLSANINIQVTKQWVMGYEYLLDEGNYYTTQGASIDKSAPATGYGLRWSYFFADVGASSFYVAMGMGSMDRTFKKNGYTDFIIKGSYALVEIGKRINFTNWFFMSGNIEYLASNLDSFHYFDTDKLEADTHYTLLKLNIGFMY